MNKNSSPPRLPLRFFCWYCHPDYQEDIEGDLLERFERNVKEKGEKTARWKLALDILLLFRLGIIRPFNSTPSLTHYDMFKNYFKITIRGLLRRKVYSGINILGLSIGMACCLLIFQYIVFEYSFDTFHKNAPTIYRVNQTTVRAGGDPATEATSGWAMGPTLVREVPEVARFVRLHPEYDNAIIVNPAQPDKSFEEEWVYYADSTFFKMFSYPLISGNPNQALSEPGTIILSESIAKKYFSDEDPMGQTLDVRGWINGTYRVDGVFRDTPDNSHLQFDVLLPMVDLLEKSDFSNPKTGWSWTNFITYVQLHQEADMAAVKQKSTDIFLKNREEDFKSTNTTGYLSFQPLLDIHLNEDIPAPKAAMGSYRAVYFFAIIGLVTLLIAFVNYINLTTARALDRAREVGIRKVVGALRRQLITQFLSESALTILLAFMLAIVMTKAFKPVITYWTGISLGDTLWTNPNFWIAFVILFCASTLLAGLYPALMLSSFKPVAVLKGKGSRSATSVRLRQGLVVFQFTTSIALLAGTFIVQHQLHYIVNMDLGIGLEQIMTVSAPRLLPEKSNQADAIETFTQELNRLPAVRQTATSEALPGKDFSFGTDNIRKAEADPSTDIPGSATYIDTAFTSLYNLELIAGNGFKGISLPIPKDEPKPILANETAIHALGFDTPEDALQQDVLIVGNRGRIMGVLKDFHWSSAHQEQEVAFFFLRQGNLYISIKVNTENLSQTIADIEKTYKQLFPGNPFQYAFADETFEAQYQNDQRFAKLFNLFAGLAIFIACLGLFGLATFTAQQRKKEIGVRKVLGATLANVVMLLSKDFLKLVLIGFLAAIPIAWFTMSRWLEDFAYHIQIGVGVFLLAGIAAVLIAVATVSWQSLKAALANPVDSLRDE